MQQKADFTVTPMTTDTVSVVAELAKACFSTPWTESIYRRELDNPSAITFLAWDTSKPIGFINCGYVLNELTLNALAVLPTHRHQGVAQTLWYTVVETIRGVCDCCLLEVRESNIAARALYEKLGFVQDGYRARYYQDPPEAAVLMRVIL